MNTLNFIVWSGSPELFSFNSPIGEISLRWYGILFALGFLISQQILYHIHRKEGKPDADVETLTIYMIVATILGARLGHVIFYQPEIIWQDPLGVLLPFEFKPEFRFTGLMGLASHGGAIGILFALWLYSRRKVKVMSDDGKTVLRMERRPNQNYLQVLDRIVILVALTGCLIRLGNFFNSEILGTPTSWPTGIVFANQAKATISGDPRRATNPVDVVSIKANPEIPDTIPGKGPLQILILYRPGVPEQEVQYHINSELQERLFYSPESVEAPTGLGLRNKTLLDPRTNQVIARVEINGIKRHPAQLYESISCLILFIVLFSIWNKYKINLPEGRIFGIFMIVLWTLRFLYEFLKENQVSFEKNMPINMGQILSIPLIIIGIYILVRSYKQPAPTA
ncbi:MAG: prolipoprotein diacylglyceryl transferase [Cyclobacteriaceae bacterium]|nr:prolipoprotein diacylglyceryl transferase [Cyclobacteriaceae bacterium]